MRWWDTSALLCLLLAQSQTEELRGFLSSDRDVVVWWGTKVEGISTLARLHRQNHVSDAEIRRLLGQLETLLSAAHEVQPSEEVRSNACRLLRTHRLRAAEALQLAGALVWAEHRPAGLSFVCLDQRLREAALREGFEVLPEPP